jgi:lysophospholipid acyltransferase (LPLAT)-like uncharacterized protein
MGRTWAGPDRHWKPAPRSGYVGRNRDGWGDMGLRDLRKRIAGSERLNEALAAAFAGYVRVCHRTTRWTREGFDDLRGHLATGHPAVVVIWHQRLMMSPYLFDLGAGRICSLTSRARAGRLAGRMQAQFGFETIAISAQPQQVALTRAVLSRMKEGVSVGIAPDGANGPARVAKTFPLVWSRSSGEPIFLVAYSGRRSLTLPTWDRMMLPLPFTRGALLVRRFSEEVPRKLDEAEMERLRLKLEAELSALTDEADRIAGRR